MPLHCLGRSVQSDLLRRRDARGLKLVPMAQTSGLHAATHGRIWCRKTPCVTIRDRHSVSGAVLQRSSLPDERPEPAEFATDALPDYACWLRINLVCSLIMRCGHRPVEEISFQVTAIFDNDLAKRRLSTLRRCSLQRDMSSAPQVAGNSGLFLERKTSTKGSS
jgi:hypothetical protein